jgi:hypothetical protein
VSVEAAWRERAKADHALPIGLATAWIAAEEGSGG